MLKMFNEVISNLDRYYILMIHLTFQFNIKN